MDNPHSAEEMSCEWEDKNSLCTGHSGTLPYKMHEIPEATGLLGKTSNSPLKRRIAAERTYCGKLGYVMVGFCIAAVFFASWCWYRHKMLNGSANLGDVDSAKTPEAASVRPNPPDSSNDENSSNQRSPQDSTIATTSAEGNAADVLENCDILVRDLDKNAIGDNWRVLRPVSNLSLNSTACALIRPGIKIVDVAVEGKTLVNDEIPAAFYEKLSSETVVHFTFSVPAAARPAETEKAEQAVETSGETIRSNSVDTSVNEAVSSSTTVQQAEVAIPLPSSVINPDVKANSGIEESDNSRGSFPTASSVESKHVCFLAFVVFVFAGSMSWCTRLKRQQRELCRRMVATEALVQFSDHPLLLDEGESITE